MFAVHQNLELFTLISSMVYNPQGDGGLVQIGRKNVWCRPLVIRVAKLVALTALRAGSFATTNEYINKLHQDSNKLEDRLVVVPLRLLIWICMY